MSGCEVYGFVCQLWFVARAWTSRTGGREFLMVAGLHIVGAALVSWVVLKSVLFSFTRF